MDRLHSLFEEIISSDFYRNILRMFSGIFVARLIPALFAVVIARIYAPESFGVFVLFLPGFLLISALYPRSGELDGLERAALSIGLSLAIVPLIGLVLNYTPWGIRLEPIMVSMALFAEIMAVVCVARRFRYFQLRLK